LVQVKGWQRSFQPSMKGFDRSDDVRGVEQVAPASRDAPDRGRGASSASPPNDIVPRATRP
jgi:hypothetical protein